uniref:EOG090X0GJG n=1 Tax=Simocephalus serrulatus TaxID=117539 RepID=A0A4Y7NQ27_9CRUS|nr:EOG090X0GJG [Simocephalus serrulatus]SVE94574.1 EOG090X0GJG [Simocephalus serrulatus]
MMDEEEYMIPIFIPHLRSPNNQQLSPIINEDTNRNQLESNGFYLHLSFSGNRGINRPSSIQLPSHSVEEEAKRCEEELDISRQTLSRLESEVAQLERVNEGLSSDNEFRELINLEQAMKRFEQDLADCRILAQQSTQELANKTAMAIAIRTKRLETERTLRELQLSICRRKLEYATARALDESTTEEDPLPVSNLPEEEERMAELQGELDELNQKNIRAEAEVQEAYRHNATRQNDLARTQRDVEQRISIAKMSWSSLMWKCNISLIDGVPVFILVFTRKIHCRLANNEFQNWPLEFDYLVKMKSAEELQQKLYYLLEQLQEMARKLPLQYQQRMPYELLSGLANCLLNETIFKIVEGLTEIQQVTEKQLLQQRLKLLHRHRAEKEALAKKPIDPNTETEKEQVLANHSDELKQADMNLILQLDQLVADQQSTLEKAGVPGFYSTSNPQEIKVQMYLLEFILKLGKESELNSL